MQLSWNEALEQLRWGSDGLLPVTTVDHDSGTVLMAAWVNKEALCETFKRKQAVYWSRSRDELWHKGATSGNVQHIKRYVLTAMATFCYTSLRLPDQLAILDGHPVLVGTCRQSMASHATDLL